jgi:signal transduction histidine kinase
VRSHFYSENSEAYLSEGSNQDLSLESNLSDLPLYDLTISTQELGITFVKMLEKYPLLPGAILLNDDKFVGILSRQRFLEYLIRPQGLDIFLSQPLEVVYSYARTFMLMLSEDTPILTASQLALRRSRELQGEPIVVKLRSKAYRLLDIHTLNIASWQIRGIETQVRYEKTQVQMIQSKKMASLGRLVDGVAHEILDPVGFIWGNLTYVDNYTKNLMELVAVYQKYFTQSIPEISELKEEIDYDFLQEDLPRTLGSIKAGAERLSKLATGLQNFCHIDEVHPKPADLHTLIDGILLLLKSRLKGEIKVIKNYGYLPPITCYSGQLHQVFMNILSNAIDALINDAVSQKFAQEFPEMISQKEKQKPCIEITTTVDQSETPIDPEKPDTRWVSIKIADNGPGMSLETRQRILESFSTKKRAQKETSLAVSYQIVTAKHGGFLKLISPYISSDTSEGRGTEFEILLPFV